MLGVSRATARFIADGHPWVRPDRYTVGLQAFKAGDVATLVTEDGTRLASALVDPGAEVCARVFHRRPDMAFRPEDALEKAVERRAALFSDPHTDCFRVVHGEADHLPGIRIERYADVFVVLVLSACAAPSVPKITAWLRARFPQAAVVIRDHRDDLRREDVASRRADGQALDPEGVVIGRELGLSYPLRPFGGLATGLYVDQRQTRTWLQQHAPGARTLNLFAYTGAFSMALLGAGAASAVDVDLAGPALKRAEEAAAMNGLSARHTTIKADCGRWLATCRDDFDIIIVDPPTAAMGGDGWVLRRDYPAILELSLKRLALGGLLVACCNTLGGKPFPLGETLNGAAARAGVATSEVEGPGLGVDVPQIKGFPEGRPFRLSIARRR